MSNTVLENKSTGFHFLCFIGGIGKRFQNLNSIIKIEKAPYSRYLFNNPVYNLHSKGFIRFYAAGRDAIYLTDRDGLVYIIGSQHPNELLRAIQEEMK